MATIREHFDTDARAMTVHGDWTFSTLAGAEIAVVVAKIALDFDANAKYWYFYVPPQFDPIEASEAIFSCSETSMCLLSPEGDGASITFGLAGYSEKVESDSLYFTKRVFLYVDATLDAAGRSELARRGATHGFVVVTRDQEYARIRSENEKPLAFISHDSRDKDAVVRELAQELSSLMCPVWYDEYSLRVGDSLRQKIETGLREARKCIVVLSPNFLANGGWGRAEFDSIFTREILEQSNVVLPVWHNVTAREVFEYSPRLANKLALSTSIGIKELANKLCGAIKASA